MTDGTNNGIDGYSQTRVGDHTILTPKDKKASVYQKVTPREQYAVARDVANRAINEINAIRADRPSSFTGGINDANIAARMQAAETYGDTLSSREPEASPTFAPRIGPGSIVGAVSSLFGGLRGGSPPPLGSRNLIDADRVRATAPQISEIKGDWGYGPSIRYPEPGQQVTPTPVDPDPTPTDPVIVDDETSFSTWKPTDNYDGGGYIPGQFGVGPKYSEYEDLFRRSINEGFTLEEAMKLSRTATPYDWEQAFGSADQWKKIGGGKNQGGGTGVGGRKGGKKGKGGGGNNGGKGGGGVSGKRGQGKTRCDIRLKTDIAPLMSTEINDDLAELAFFVKELRVK